MFPAYCDAVLEDLGKVGFAIEAVRLTAGEFVDGLDFVIGTWIADYPDADSMVRLLLHSRDGVMGHFCGHPQIDELSERAGSERDPILRRTLYQRIEELVAEHCLFVPLFHGPTRAPRADCRKRGPHGWDRLLGAVAGALGLTKIFVE
jgi:ABC-type oligopeptide transport system substrate-binding subunit